MNDETERVTVGPDSIRVYGKIPKIPPNICGCGHHKSFHSCAGTGACWHAAFFIAICPCMTYVAIESAPDTSRKRSPLLVVIVILLVAILALLIGIATGHAQEIPSRVMLDAEGGSASGLGFRLPSLVFGTVLEMPITRRWEAQGSAKWSPDDKYITHDGNQAQIAGNALFWANNRVAFNGGIRFNRLWTSQFDKTAWNPVAGIVLRNNWQGAPGRLYLTYSFPTGCQWATSANPCRIQSNRESGVEGYSEFRFWPHWRIGFRMAWVHYADQSNPLQPSAGRRWHDTGTTAMVIRYLFRAEPGDASY